MNKCIATTVDDSNSFINCEIELTIAGLPVYVFHKWNYTFAPEKTILFFFFIYEFYIIFFLVF